MGDSQPSQGAAPQGSPPESPKKNDTWLDDCGDLYTYDGEDWIPFEDVTWFEPNTSFRDV